MIQNKNSLPKIVSVLRKDNLPTPEFVMTDTINQRLSVVIPNPNITLGILKPDAIVRGLEDKIYQRIMDDKIRVWKLDKRKLSDKDVNVLYGKHAMAPYYPEILAFMMSIEVEIFLGEGNDVVSRLSALVGKTNPLEAQRGTIRGDYFTSTLAFPQFLNIYQNIIHSSDKLNVDRELQYFLMLRSQDGYKL